jgi:hypothetical protein
MIKPSFKRSYCVIDTLSRAKTVKRDQLIEEIYDKKALMLTLKNKLNKAVRNIKNEEKKVSKY